MWPEAHDIAAACTGCMYGSFPEISISARFVRPMLQRAALFMRGGPRRRLVPMSAEELADLAVTTRRDVVGSAA